MAQKFFDIFPPDKSADRKDKRLDEIKEEPAFEKPQEEIRPVEKKAAVLKRAPKRGLLFKIVVPLAVLILAAIFIPSLFSKTEIMIWPKIESLALEEKFTVDANQTTDLAAKVFSARVFEEEKSVSQEFSATGKVLKEDKATGIIQVYNAHSAISQVLVVSTRFVSSDGKVFKTLRKITVPGATYDKGKLVPGSTSVEVQAAQAGEEYNINPSTFSIPGFAGTSKYTTFYGKTFSPMAGGFRREVSQVSQNDLDQARGALIERAKGESKDSLRNTNSADFVLLDDALSQEIIESTSSPKAGSAADSFVYQVKVKSRWIGFEKNEVKSFVEEAIGSEKKLLQDSLAVDYSLEAIDKGAGEMTVDLNIRAEIYSDPDVEEIKSELLGKPIGDVDSFLAGYPYLEKVKVKSSFWKRRIPTDPQKVIIKVNIGPALTR